LELVCSVYRRSPARFAFPDGMSAPERRFAALESVYGVGGVLSAQPLVYKSLSTGVVTEQDEVRIIYTSRLTACDLDDGVIALCCHMFQEWVPKAFDVRLTVVGDRCFAVACVRRQPRGQGGLALSLR
ncbi:MAG TPA: hypothetical protein VJT72_03325, partial [Pseudonocardiaceae bacterium]|nr:hypothetical protein [Pseudonocardiaceae bacterium]